MVLPCIQIKISRSTFFATFLSIHLSRAHPKKSVGDLNSKSLACIKKRVAFLNASKYDVRNIQKQVELATNT